MNMSEKKKAELYNAIYEPTMNARIRNWRDDLMTTTQVDALLFNLQNEIWRAVHQALKLSGPA